MKKSVIFLVILVWVAMVPAGAQQVEVGQGDYQIDNICAGKMGEGVEKTFYDAAKTQLKFKAYCKNGQINGVVKKYNASGKIRVKAEYVDGRLSGVTKLHDDGGTLLFRDEYENGVKKGRYTYNDKGEMVQVH